MFKLFTDKVSTIVGKPITFCIACAVIIIWAISGFVFNFSEIWQLFINTGTTIITFLLLFIVQATQNRDNKALHAKIDDLIRAIQAADNRFIKSEELSEEEIDKLRENE